MRKTNKTKSTARRAIRATQTALKKLAVTELAAALHQRRDADIPNLSFAPLQFCALALNSK